MRYFFHTKDGVAVDDAEGLELASTKEALQVGTQALGELIQDYGRTDRPVSDLQLTITDADGLVLCVFDVTATLAPSIHLRMFQR